MGVNLNAKTNIKIDFVSDINDEHSPINEIETYSYTNVTRKSGQTPSRLSRAENLRLM